MDIEARSALMVRTNSVRSANLTSLRVICPFLSFCWELLLPQFWGPYLIAYEGNCIISLRNRDNPPRILETKIRRVGLETKLGSIVSR